MCCPSCKSLNSVQSFVIENCNGPTIENGLNNVCLHPLSRTFTLVRASFGSRSCAPDESGRTKKNDNRLPFFVH